MFLHGYGGSKTAWQKTPYSEGFADMFLADGYSIYLADQPMYGSAAKVSKDAIVPAKPDDLVWFTQFRLGLWPDFQEGTQFPVSKENIDQFFRMMTVSVGDFDLQMVNNAMAAALEKSGPAVLVTHSQGGIPGWFIAGESPIVVYFGDYIPDEPSEIPVQDHWRVTRDHAHLFADCVNRHGGDAKVVYLPDEGIHGNSHFLFQEKNNRQIYEHIRKWMDQRNI